MAPATSTPARPRGHAAGAPAAAKRAAHRLLGPGLYLRLVSGGFFAAMRLGLLRGRPAFDTHHFLAHLVRRGDVALDIGANLGYFTLPLARLVGPEGRVIAVEPVEVYRGILEGRARRHSNVEVLPFALGSGEGVTVKLGLPEGAEEHRHGLARVRTDGAGAFEATMRRGSVLFAGLNRLDFVKCDVEGYELEVLPEMIEVIEHHRPILLVETEGESRERMVVLLSRLGYRAFVVRGEGLRTLATAPDTPGDVVFVPPARHAELSPLMEESPQ